MIIKLDNKNVRFVRKAEYGVPVSQQAQPSSSPSFGIQRPSHKYAKRETLGSGKHRYIYDEARGSKAPPEKDAREMIEDFKSIMQSDKEWKKFANHFDDSDFNGISNAMNIRGDEITPENFIMELNNAKSALGSRVNEFLPTSVIVKEYKKLFEMAGSRPSEYNSKIEEGMNKKQLNDKRNTDADMSDLYASGLSEQALQELKNNPKKVKKLIDKLKKLSTIKHL